MKVKHLLLLLSAQALMLAFQSSVPKQTSQFDDSSRPVVTQTITVCEVKPLLEYIEDKEAEVTIGQIFQDDLDWIMGSLASAFLVGLRSIYRYFSKRRRDLKDLFDSDPGLFAVIGLFFFIPCCLFLFLRIIVFLMMDR